MGFSTFRRASGFRRLAICSFECLAVTVLWTPDLIAQATEKDAERPAESDQSEEQPRLAVMNDRAAAIHPWLLREDRRITLEGFKEPLFRLDDPTRNYPDGTLWAWPRKGRPAAMLTLSIMGGPPPRWLYEFVSLSEQPIGTQTGAIAWSCKKPGWQPRQLADEKSPAASERERLREMRAIARRFNAAEFLPPPMRFELRLLPQPVLRYSDPGAGQLDGAVFLFCMGTNPEILLIVEARQQPEENAVWQYGLARNTIAALQVDLDGKQVWNQPYIRFSDAGYDQPYCIVVDSVAGSELPAVTP